MDRRYPGEALEARWNDAQDAKARQSRLERQIRGVDQRIGDARQRGSLHRCLINTAAQPGQYAVIDQPVERHVQAGALLAQYLLQIT